MPLLRALDRSALGAPPADLTRRRLFELGGLGGLAMAALAARLGQLQLREGADNLARADRNRLRAAPIPAARGLIHDRNGVAMVRNRPSFTVAVVPADLPNRPDEVLRRLARLTGGSAAAYGRALARPGLDPIAPLALETTDDPAVARAIEERRAELPGVAVTAEPFREYPDGALTSHLVGHVGPISARQLAESGGAQGPYGPSDRVGQAGVEAVFEPDLRGARGTRRVEMDATGREVRVVGLEPPRPGRGLRLAVDLPFQREVHRILAERIAQFEVASVVALDPASGQVLAMAHLPAYDNRALAGGLSDEEFAALVADPTRPLLNGAIGSAWPPGSCFKVITALAALEAGVVTPRTRITCPGGIRLPGGGTLKCWAAHGPQDMVSALAVSCDTYFYHLAGGEPGGRWPGVGPERLAEWAKLFGLGEPTGIELPAEAPGLVPTPAWKQQRQGEPWHPADTYMSGIGQGFYTATPLQMAVVAATLANGGDVLRPRVALDTTDGDGRPARAYEREPVRRPPIDPEHLRVVQAGVRAGMLVDTSPTGVKYIGTSYDSNIRGFPIAGKTGTAEYGTPGPDGKPPTHGWFIFWAPYEAPRLAGVVFVARGRGSQEAAKVGAQVVRAYFGLA